MPDRFRRSVASVLQAASTIPLPTGSLASPHEVGHHVQNLLGISDRVHEAQGRVVLDSFTHGTSAQRLRWFRKGLETGDFAQGDTFAAREL